MLYPGLEAAIQKGLAQYQTFVFGVGGVGRIPVPKGSFIIITDFDYFYFIDTPEPVVVGDPARMAFSFTSLVAVTEVTFQINGLPVIAPVINFDAGDILQTQIDFQAMLNTYFPGFTALVFGAGGAWFVEVTTTAPGAAYNGITPNITFNPVPPIVDISPFQYGTASVTSRDNINANSTHQLEFRSTKSRNHFIIRENVQIDEFLAINEEGEAIENILSYNVRGFYHRDTYLVHTESVQINVIKVPPPSSWVGSTYLPPSPRSQEFSQPVGYGQTISPVLIPTMRQAVFVPGEAYDPLTKQFEDLPGVAQDQLKLNVIPGRELVDPTLPATGTSNDRNYPVINIGYVLVNKEYNDFVKSS